MKIEKLSLTSFKGGLNDRDPASGIAVTEASVLENYFTDKGGLLSKRPGQEIIQFAPINPVPFVDDADTVALYHLNEAAEPYLNAHAGGLSLQDPDSIIGGFTRVTQPAASIFTSARKIFRGQPAFVVGGNGTFLGASDIAAFPAQIHGAAACTFDAWVNPDGTWNGAPVPVSVGPPGSVLHYSNSPNGIGVPLLATFNFAAADQVPDSNALSNGLSICRDWDYVNHKNATDIYVKFRIQTASGTGFTFVEVKGGTIQAGKWTHIRGSYNSVTGYVSLFANGTLIAQGTTTGTVYDPPPAAAPLDAYAYAVGGCIAVQVDYTTGAVSTTTVPTTASAFAGLIDEVRISSIDRGASGFPFDYPRGMGFEFSKSDGTRQAVVSATDKLWYTVGDGAWTQMKFGDGTVPAFSRTAYWDAIFRKDILYLADGVDQTLAWDGSTLVSWMKPTVAPTLTLSADIGTITSGVHQVAYSYLYGIYETGLSPIQTIINAGGEQINVSAIPPRHANCTGVRIYMDKTGVPGEFYLARQIAHTPGADMSISGIYTAGTPSYDTDAGALGPADASLGGAGFPLIAPEVVTARSPNPKYLLAEHDRAFVCGMEDEAYALRWSQLGALDVFSVFSFAQAAANQGNLIALASYYGEVHCSKDGRATLILRGSNPQNWSVLETLHPNIGAIDHWSYVHRYPVDSDHYVLCFKARDGFYKYAGQQIECISDKIKGTTDRLTSNNGTRNEWQTTTGAQWQSQAPSGGSATINVQALRYETDGLRQISGKAQIVDQLDYLGLYRNSDRLVPGNIVAQCKGAAEGEFWFATDTANTLWHTLDNFQTLSPAGGYAVGGATERIIEIVKRGTDDYYFLFTDTAHATAGNLSSAGGYVYTWDNNAGVVLPLYNAAPLYYNLDVPIRLQAAQIGSSNSYTFGPGPSFTFASAPFNLFVNHSQSVFTAGGLNASDAIFQATAIGTVATVNTGKNSHSNGYSDSIAHGFYAWSGFTSFSVIYTRREFPLWRGGTFRPQAYWDATHSQLVFLATTPDDANGNSFSYLRTWDLANGLVNQYTAENVSALTTDGTNLFFWTVVAAGAGGTGFNGNLRQSLLTAPGVTIGGTATAQQYLLALRLSYNAQNATAYLGSFKSFFNGVQEFWSYTASLQKIPVATSIPASLLALTVDGDSGPVIPEIALQTTLPYKWFAAVTRLSSTDSVALYGIAADATATVTTQQGNAYQGPDASAATTGIISNLLFVPASGLAGGNLWADRLYWYATAALPADSRFVQLGVEGNWTVIGVLASEPHNLGVFDSFADLDSAFSNGNNAVGLLYELRNAADAAALVLAAYQGQTPNSRILGFAPALAYVQWRLTFTWTFDATTGAVVTTSPSTDFVNISYFLGLSNLPRVVGFHWEGRTFWACSEDNSPQNNVVLCYQKNAAWTKIYGWPVKSIFRFRNQMVALQDYEFVRLMVNVTDMGRLIVGKARTGAILGYFDKLICRIQANIMAFANSLFSSASGYVKITPYRGDTEVADGAWVMPVPNAIAREPHRVLGVPNDEFTYNWIRALSLEIKTSEDLTGSWVPVIEQPEEIQQIDLELELTGDAYDLVVE